MTLTPTWVTAVVLVLALCPVTTRGQGLVSCEYDADSCGCKTDKGLISLKKYGEKGLSYVDISSSARYTWNPCRDMTIGTTKVACIQDFPELLLAFDLGTHDSTTSSVKEGVATFYLQATVESRQSEIKCTCASGEDFKFVSEEPQGYYNLELSSHACCPGGGSASGGKSKGLSGGSYLLIVFFSLVFVYLVAGVALQAGLKKAEGKDRIPHVTFWVALPGLIKDGFRFIFSCGKKQSYGEI